MTLRSLVRVSREEIKELENYLENESWDWKNSYAKGGGIDIFQKSDSGFIYKKTIPQGDGSESYPTMGGEVFDSSKVTEVAMSSGEFGSSSEFKRELGAAMTAKSAGVPVDKVPESTMNALTRDYSGLMKALDKKDSNGV